MGRLNEECTDEPGNEKTWEAAARREPETWDPQVAA